VTEALENCQFNTALEETRNFTWHIFCDCYLEAVKDRLYRPESYGEDKKRAAQYALHVVLNRILHLLAPIAPHITEEVYHTLYAEDVEQGSIHRSSWPRIDKTRLDEEAEKGGDLIMAIIMEVRREKAEKHLPLNAPIKKLTIYAGEKSIGETIAEGKVDISGACKVADMEILPLKGEGREAKPFNISFIADYQ
jgi:valyl-tRNA synthetase